MNPAQASLIEQARARFGQRIAITDAVDIEPWLTDWRGRWTGRAEAILQPGSTDEVAALVRMAGEANVPLVPQGGNTSMVGGATPPEDGSALILSLRRMNRIRSIDRSAMRAVAEGGVILQNLHDVAASEGLRFPLTLGARGSATVGGLVSTNAGGTQVLRFGPMRALVEGVEAVLPDGTIHDGLGGLKKDNRGPSIDQLLIGAEGTLGIVTAARLRLVPAANGRAVAWLGLASPQAALDALRALERQSDRIEGFELLPAESLDAAIAQLSGARAPLDGRHKWHVLVEMTGADAAEILPNLLAPLVDSGLVVDATIASSEAQAEAFWRLRDGLSEAEKAAYGPATQHDISVPVEAMPRFMTDAALAVEQAFPGTRASGFGHLGDGNVHFHVRAGSRADDGWLGREGGAVSRFVHDLVAAAGGSISAEHGIGQMKRDELARLDPVRVAHIRSIKAALDPLGLMNPGKLV
ncbi:FAD-binding oxidoreductase [Sphingomonas sp. LY160]|uniref:FAD-binding oxidoreductase n=1 Tax=Sphingomonas sp. LY160 TaxID=3095342 RepID=UPI002ADEE714|nr:FAD-binding oxidoreductase [Sphingomonas sp. LY160]MEA1071811.1 FAD-binding oxidoreductase [Sphingomonas sp. LY160]